MKHGNLILLGTSHIAKQSIEEVERHIATEKPGIVALELDRHRLEALLDEKKRGISLGGIWRIGIKGFIFSLIGAWAEKKLGETVGVSPGSEMKRAFQLAKERKLKVALIDQHIGVTLKKISKELTWKEKWHFVVDAFKAVVLRKKEVVFDLSKVPSEKVIKNLTGKVRRRYPNLYRILVVERNEVMAARLASLCSSHPEGKILAIIGAGHEKEIMALVKNHLAKPKITYSITVN